MQYPKLGAVSCSFHHFFSSKYKRSHIPIAPLAFIYEITTLNNNLKGFTPICDVTGRITGYKTNIGGADTVFPFSNGRFLIRGKVELTNNINFTVTQEFSLTVTIPSSGSIATGWLLDSRTPGYVEKARITITSITRID